MAKTQADDNVVSFSEGIIEGERPPLVEPGNYDLAFMFHRTAYLFGRAPKLSLHFRIVSHGPHFETAICRWYNVKTLNSKPRKGGSFKVSWGCDFVREYVTLFGMPARIDRISTETFKTQVIRGRVVTVDKDRQGRSIPVPLQYSVISELLETMK